MTAFEKQKVLEAIDVCVRCDLFTEIEVDQIMQLCYAAIDRLARNGIPIGSLEKTQSFLTMVKAAKEGE